MSVSLEREIVITGVGFVTPLGDTPAGVLDRMEARECAALTTSFSPGSFDCPVYSQVQEFVPQDYVSEPKLVRLMNRDAQFAVVAARRALEDAGLRSHNVYSPAEIALFGATGLAGLPVREVAPLLRVSLDSEGRFDLTRFGQAGIRAVSPILSFKILSNMPFCFVSINEGIQGPNAIYTPWEGQGAQAIEAGIRAIQRGETDCALVGGCDQKTHELAFASLQQQGLFSSWRETGKGVIPSEGSCFLVLESAHAASSRGARTYATISGFALHPRTEQEEVTHTQSSLLKHLPLGGVNAVVSAANGDENTDHQEREVLREAGIRATSVLTPKRHAGDLFAAAAALQVAVAASAIQRGSGSVLANCFGHGNTQAAFVLSPA